MLRKIMNAVGYVFVAGGFLALWAGCAIIDSSCAFTGGALVAIAGLAVFALGVTMCGAWYVPGRDDGADREYRASDQHRFLNF